MSHFREMFKDASGSHPYTIYIYICTYIYTIPYKRDNDDYFFVLYNIVCHRRAYKLELKINGKIYF